MATVGFSDLPTEALDEIARRVGPFDNVTCSAVCKPWRCALKATRLRSLEQPNFPHTVALLSWRNAVEVSPVHRSRGSSRSLVPLQQQGGEDDASSAAATHHRDRPVRVIGCAYGWAVVLDTECAALSLLDPLTGRRFPLPPLSGKKAQRDLGLLGQKAMFHKAVAAPGRRLGSYAVMLIHSGGHALSFLLAPGGSSKPAGWIWTTLRAPAWTPSKYLDAVFHKGAFHTVSLDTEMNAWAVLPPLPDGGKSGGGMRARRVTEPRTERVEAALVKSMIDDGDLMMVSSADKGRSYEVSRYDDEGGGGGRWVPVKDLGEAAIFVGRSCSVCAPTRSGAAWPWPPRSNFLYFSHFCRPTSGPYYRLPAAADRCGQQDINTGSWLGTWFLPYVAPEFHHR